MKFVTKFSVCGKLNVRRQSLSSLNMGKKINIMPNYFLKLLCSERTHWYFLHAYIAMGYKNLFLNNKFHIFTDIKKKHYLSSKCDNF